MKHTVEILYTFDDIVQLLADANGADRRDVFTYGDTKYIDDDGDCVEGDTFMFRVRKDPRRRNTK